MCVNLPFHVSAAVKNKALNITVSVQKSFLKISRDYPPVVESEALLLSTDQEMIDGRKAIDAHAQDVRVIEELPLPILKAFEQ